ncbi:helix-turn-helix transcriptional regulator [Flavobacterium sp. MXW15]|uniref:Helix-turn-helix transcriptional regulator n=1 Tax=Xanthomonas chitinilytica TaxID=2989819 RepID=A0ABT3JS38_9XANT|nr:helix-turn-helix transcriptional regulator [Xanthomonas sp. H13-6]MCW4453658.1 helix-turn-helix transcriptional regulator [Flavobacterium sp. MXW15]MCW4471291.1 helix-turn-helix transcriptional regulator [Xanthomonas sp. H13-6]
MRRLTPREREIIRLIPIHSRVDQQAALLGISRCTVRKHRANICEKLGLRGSAQLIAHAHGLSRPKVDFRAQ